MTDKTLTMLASHGDVWCMDLSAAPRFLAEVERGVEGPRRRMPKAQGAVAVIPVYGVITKRGMWGEGGTDRLIRTIEAAIASSSVSGVLLDVDSPGGSSYGLKEFSDRLFALRGGKPIVAIANTVAASAALWSASSADRFVVTPSGEVGSLGVWSLHIDYSKALYDAGVKPTFIFAGKHKVDGNPYEPLSDEARADIQEGVDDTYGQFVEAMSRNRKAAKSKVKAEFGEGRMLLPQQALSVGMVDRIATMDEVLREMGATEGVSIAAAITEHLCNVWDEKPQASATRGHVVEAAKARRERLRGRAVV